MFDKSNKNYKLYLAGVISESQYMDLCELVDPYSKSMNPGPTQGAVGPQGHVEAEEKLTPEQEESLKVADGEFMKSLEQPLNRLFDKLDANVKGMQRRKQFMGSLVHKLAGMFGINMNQMQAITRNSYK